MRKGQKHTEKTKNKISDIVLCGVRDGRIPISPAAFKKGCVPWNKGVKGLHLNPETEFRAGPDHTMEKHPGWKGGVQVVSKDCVLLNVATNRRIRRPKMVFEKNFGPMPVGCVIYHLDGNRHNDDPLNLIAVTRAELLRLNRGGSICRK